MSGSRPDDDHAGCADGLRLVAVHSVPGQAAPVRVTVRGDLDTFACRALPAADRLLARQGAGLAVRGNVAAGQDAAAALAHAVAPGILTSK